MSIAKLYICVISIRIIHPKVFHVCNNYWVVSKIVTSQLWKIIEENKLHSINSDVD